MISDIYLMQLSFSYFYSVEHKNLKNEINSFHHHLSKNHLYERVSGFHNPQNKLIIENSYKQIKGTIVFFAY